MIRAARHLRKRWSTTSSRPIFAVDSARNLPVPRTFRHLFSEALLRAAVVPVARGLWHAKSVPGQIEGLEGPCFVYGNHSNNLDAFIFNIFRPWGEASSGVLTAEYMRGGPVSAALRGIGLLATRKRVPEPHLIGRIMRLLDQGRMICIYPEGGRRWDGRPRPWIESTAKLFKRVGVPVYPVLTHGSYVGWPRWARFPRPARIRIEVLPAVELSRDMDTAEAIDRLAAPIDIDENEPPIDVRPRHAFRPAEGIERLLYRDPVTGRHGGLFTPDGHRIVNADRSVRWRMLADSRIRDERTGEVLLTGDLYDRARRMPIDPDADGRLLTDTVRFHSGPPYAHAVPHGTARLTMYRDHVRIDAGNASRIVAADAIRAAEIERNFKLELALDDTVLRFDFVFGGSALQWHDVLSARTALGPYAPNAV